MREYRNRFIGAARVVTIAVVVALLLGSTANVAADTPTILLTASPDPAWATQPVTFTATVDPVAAGERVRFQEWNDLDSSWATFAEVDLDPSGSAAFVTANLSSAAPHVFRAALLDSGGVLVGTSESVTEVVNLRATTTTLSLDGTSYPYQVSPLAHVSFTAIDVSSLIEVRVERPDGAWMETTRSVATIPGQTDASIVIPAPGYPGLLVPGPYVAKARFSGGGTWADSWSEPVNFTVTQIPTTTSISTTYPWTGPTEDFTVAVVVTGIAGINPVGGSASLLFDGYPLASGVVGPDGTAAIVVHPDQLIPRGLTLLGRHQLSVTYSDLTRTAYGGSTSQTLIHDIIDAVYATDQFSRSLSTGWGTAGLGGPYSLQGTAADFAVTGAVGTMTVAAAANRAALLAGISPADTDVSFRFALDRLPIGGQAYVYGVLRHVGSTTEYRAKVRLAPTGAVYLQATATVNGTETSLGPEVRVSGLTAAPGSFIWLRAQVSGSGPSTLRLRAWAEGSVEPTSWSFSATSGVAALQMAGSVGLRTYIDHGITNGPIVVSFDDLRVAAVGG